MKLENQLKLTYSSSVEQLCTVNSSFDAGVLKVAYVGKNRNGSSISKEAFERSIHTIYNCPIVCNYDREGDAIGSHDMEVVQKNGEMRLVNLTQPVGVIPESANYWWETYEDKNVSREYLCVDALIWKRQEAYQKIKDNVVTDESMEIKVLDGRMKDGVYVIDAFEFLAFCLLESAEPCYESASLKMFEADEFRAQYVQMMEDFKESFALVSSPNGVDIRIKNYSGKGGEETLDKKAEVLAEFGVTEEQLDFDIQGMTEDELRAELEKRKGSEGKQEFTLSGEQFREELIRALSEEKVTTEWGEHNRYCYFDYDMEKSEVYCYDTQDWLLYGFSYSVNGDTLSVDFASKKRKRISVVDFDGGEAEPTSQFTLDEVGKVFAAKKEAEISAQFAQEKGELEEKFRVASEKIVTQDEELNELRAFKEERIEMDREEREQEVFAMFPDLDGVEAFTNLKAECGDMTIEELENACYAIRGRTMSVKNFSMQKKKPPRLPVEKTHGGDDEPYGGLFLEFKPGR